MKKLRKLVIVVLAILFVSGFGMILWNMLQYHAGQQAYDKALQIALQGTMPTTVSSETLPIPEETTHVSSTAPPQEQSVPMDKHARFMQEIQVLSLRKINPEILGWIYIPDTVISYPLMYSEDQKKYLNEAWDGTRNSSGSIFLEQRNDPSFSDFNTIIYGHHIINGTMFGSLKHYKDQAYADSHPYVYVCTADRIFRYRVFAAYETPVESDAYRLVFPGDTKIQALSYYLARNLLQTDILPTIKDRILTLSTCTSTGSYTNRIVVQAVLDAQWKK